MESYKTRYSTIDEIIQHRTQPKYDQRLFQGFPSLFEVRHTKRFDPVPKANCIKDRFKLKLQRSGIHCMLNNASAYLSQEEQMQELKLLLEMNIKSKRDQLKTESPLFPLNIQSNDISNKQYISNSFSEVDSNYMSLEGFTQEMMPGQKSTRYIPTKNENVLSQPQIPTELKINRISKTKFIPTENRRPAFKENLSRNKSLTHRSNTPVMPRVLRKKTLLSNISFTVTKIDTSKACSPIPTKLRSKIICEAGTNTTDTYTGFGNNKQFADSICTEASLDSVDLTFKNKLLPRFV